MAGIYHMEVHQGQLATREVVNGEKAISGYRLATPKVANPSLSEV